jgi:hypothetical protein
VSPVGRDGDGFAPSIMHRHLDEVEHAGTDLANPLRDAGTGGCRGSPAPAAW